MTLKKTMASAAMLAGAMTGIPQAHAENQEIQVSGAVRAWAAELKDRKIKFNELPEFQARISTGKIEVNFSGDSVYPKGGHYFDSKGPMKFKLGDLNLKTKVGPGTTISFGAYDLVMPSNFGEPFLVLTDAFTPVQGLEEYSFLRQIDNFRGVIISHDTTLGSGLHLSATAAVGGQKGQKGAAYYLSTDISGKLGDNTTLQIGPRIQQRQIGGAVGERAYGLRGQVAHDFSKALKLRVFGQVDHITGLDGLEGRNGTYAAVMAIGDAKITDRFSLYAAGGVYKLPQGGSAQNIEGGAAYRIVDGLTCHGGLGQVYGGPLAGRTYTYGCVAKFEFKIK